VVTKWLLEVLNVPPATLEITPRVNQKSLVSRSALGFIISGAPHFRNPYLTEVTNQLGSTLRRSRHLFEISRTLNYSFRFSTIILNVSSLKKNTKLLTLYNNTNQHQELNRIKMKQKELK
jgi:hypothetical protein